MIFKKLKFWFNKLELKKNFEFFECFISRVYDFKEDLQILDIDSQKLVAKIQKINSKRYLKKIKIF